MHFQNGKVEKFCETARTFGVNLDWAFTREDETAYSVWFCLLSELNIFVKSFDNLDCSEYVMQFYLCLDHFQMKNMMVKTRTLQMWKTANIVAFSFTKPYAAKNSTFLGVFIKLFMFLHTNCVNINYRLQDLLHYC